MSDQPGSPAAYRRSRRTILGLAGLAAFNLALVGAAKFIPAIWAALFGPQYSFEYFIGHSLALGMLVSWAIMAAFLSRRRFIGLAWTCGMSVAVAAIDWVNFQFIVPERATEMAVIGLTGHLYISLSILTVAQALRLFLSWRLQPTEEATERAAPRFQISEVIEWMISIAIWLVVAQTTSAPIRDRLGFLATSIGPIALVAFPAAMAAASASGLRPWKLTAIVAWAVALGFTEHMSIRLIDPSAFSNHPWWFFALLELTEFGCLVAVTAVNFAVIRWLGFQFTLQYLFAPKDRALRQASPST